MLKLGRLTLERGMPALAVPFGSPMAPGVVEQALTIGFDIAELRIDLYENASRESVLSEAALMKTVPTIATIRWKDEGGKWTRSEQERLELFEAILPHVDAIDVELRATEIRGIAVAAAHAAGKLAVVSFHDFGRTPSEDALHAQVTEARAAGADIVKIATHTRGDEDVRTLARLLLSNEGTPLVVIAMGVHGTKSRVFFPALGSLITFAALEQTTAPGQLPLREMVDELCRYYPGFETKRRGAPAVIPPR